MGKFLNFLFGRKSAKRYTIDFANKDIPIKSPSTGSLKEYIFNDPDLASNIRRFVDNVLIEAPKLVKTDDSSLTDKTVRQYNKQLEKVRFYRLLRSAIYHLLYNGNAFFEIKFNGKKLKEMYNIDPETIEIVVDEHGEPIQYKQSVSGSPTVTFTPDEIVHISIDNFDSGVWGNSFISSLKEVLKRKEVAEYYLQWLIQNNKFAPVVNIKAEILDENYWERVVDQINFKTIDPDFIQVINTLPDEGIEKVYLNTPEYFDKILEYIDKQKEKILAVLQVPPIISGIVDNSNRSNSEVQARLVFYNTIKSFQNIVAEELNFELLGKLNWNGVKFKFRAIDQRTDVETIKIARTMKEIGIKDDVIKNFLIDNGFKISKEDDLFLELPQGNQIPKDIDSFESRQPRDKAGLPQKEIFTQEDKKML